MLMQRVALPGPVTAPGLFNIAIEGHDALCNYSVSSNCGVLGDAAASDRKNKQEVKNK